MGVWERGLREFFLKKNKIKVEAEVEVYERVFEEIRVRLMYYNMSEYDKITFKKKPDKIKNISGAPYFLSSPRKSRGSKVRWGK